MSKDPTSQDHAEAAFRADVSRDYLEARYELRNKRWDSVQAVTMLIFRSIILLNGGAIIGLFAVLGNRTVLQFAVPSLIDAFECFAGGLILGMGSAIASYFAQSVFFQIDHDYAERLAHALREIPADRDDPPKAIWGYLSRYLSIALVLAAMVLFILGCYMALIAVVL